MVGFSSYEHDLGECEKLDGVMCEECRIEYMTRFEDMDWQDEQDNKYYNDNER